jgi:hypothetical protein
MKQWYVVIFILFVVILTFACLGISSEEPPSFQTTSKTLVPPDSATVTLEKSKYVDVSDLHYITASQVLNDNRIWAMSSIWVLDAGTEDTGCKAIVQSGQLYQSNNGGRDWELSAPPIKYSTPWCMLTQYAVDYLSDIKIVPFASGFIMQIQLFGSAPVFYWDGNTWKPIPSPIRDYQKGDPEDSGLKEMLVLPDGSGRIVAVGHDPDGISNAWMLEKPSTSWKDISSNLNNYDTIDNIIWSYNYGLVGAMKNSSTVLRLDDELHWIDLDFPKDDKFSPDRIWMGINGEVCSYDEHSSDNAENLGWDGSKWKLYDQASNCTFSLIWVAYQKYSVVEFFPLGPNDISGLFYITNNGNQFQKFVLPELENDIQSRSLTISQTGIIYFLSNDGLYSSTDIGISWKLVYVGGASG